MIGWLSAFCLEMPKLARVPSSLASTRRPCLGRQSRDASELQRLFFSDAVPSNARAADSFGLRFECAATCMAKTGPGVIRRPAKISDGPEQLGREVGDDFSGRWRCVSNIQRCNLNMELCCVCVYICPSPFVCAIWKWTHIFREFSIMHSGLSMLE